VRGVRREGVGRDDVDGQHDLDAGLLRLREVALDGLDLVLLEQRGADLVALGKVKTMPPPMSSLSALVSRFAMTPSLSETFEPPSTTT
jgi:hypothetical protein